MKANITIAVRIRIWLSRAIAFFNGRRLDRELDDELNWHLKMLMEENLRSGMNPRQAESAARRTFGGIDQTREIYRRQRGLPIFGALSQDLRYAARQFGRSPAFAATAIVTLALGIGANTAVFSLIYGLMLSSLNVPHPEQLVRYRLAPLPSNPEFSAFSSLILPDIGVNGPMAESIRKNQSACSDVFEWTTVGEMDYSNHSQHKSVAGALVSGSAFPVLGVTPALGRLLDESDDRPGGGNAGLWSADISYTFWQSEFHGDRDVIGRTLAADGVPVTVIGVLPRNFSGVIIDANPDVILPLEIDEVFAAAQGRPSVRQNDFFAQVTVMGRLKRGVSIDRAKANAQSISETMFDDGMPPAARYNPFATEQVLDVASASAGWSSYRRSYQKPLLLVQGLVAVILVLITANLGGLLLARGTSRRRELEVRGALGASRFRLIRQLLTESALLATIGIPLGCLFAWRASAVTVGFVKSPGALLEINRWHDPQVLAFAAISGLLTALVAAILPALIVTRPNAKAMFLASRSHSGSGFYGRFGNVLIPIQVALSLVLVAAAGMFVVSLERLITTPAGMRDEGVYLARTNLKQHSEGGEHPRLYTEECSITCAVKLVSSRPGWY